MSNSDFQDDIIKKAIDDFKNKILKEGINSIDNKELILSSSERERESNFLNFIEVLKATKTALNLSENDAIPYQYVTQYALQLSSIKENPKHKEYLALFQFLEKKTPAEIKSYFNRSNQRQKEFKLKYLTKNKTLYVNIVSVKTLKDTKENAKKEISENEN